MQYCAFEELSEISVHESRAIPWVSKDGKVKGHVSSYQTDPFLPLAKHCHIKLKMPSVAQSVSIAGLIRWMSQNVATFIMFLNVLY